VAAAGSRSDGSSSWVVPALEACVLILVMPAPLAGLRRRQRGSSSLVVGGTGTARLVG
jgi:hypothetical protein